MFGELRHARPFSHYTYIHIFFYYGNRYRKSYHDAGICRLWFSMAFTKSTSFTSPCQCRYIAPELSAFADSWREISFSTPRQESFHIAAPPRPRRSTDEALWWAAFYFGSSPSALHIVPRSLIGDDASVIQSLITLQELWVYYTETYHIFIRQCFSTSRRYIDINTYNYFHLPGTGWQAASSDDLWCANTPASPRRLSTGGVSLDV